MKILLTSLLTAVAIIGQAADTVWLSSLDLTKMRQGWGKPQIDRSIREQPLSIAGQKFARGVGTHASSTLWIDLGGSADRFLAKVGVDDAAGSDQASLSFKIVGDGRKLWESGVMKPGQAAQTVDVDLKGLKTLILLVHDGGDGTGFDHANWADAKFLVSGPAPKAIDVPREEAVILTPKPGPQPRINGPKIYGCRPGSPFLYTIPATGARPMKFAVEKLPRGLQVDPQSGIITGKLQQRGEFVVTFKASNKHGTARRAFKIVCGDTLALTPHMGWNSWYVWENHVTDQIMRAAADAMVSSGLINHGYQFVNIDDCWAVKPGSTDPTLGGEPRDAQGKVNANQRFPDMNALTD